MPTQREAATAELHRQQEAARTRLGVTVSIGRSDALKTALARAAIRESQSEIQGEWVHVGAFKYPVQTERRRWARTRDIINRSEPGADEDATYLEMIARQAASTEMILRGEDRDQVNIRNSQICDRVLVATIPSLNPGAFSRGYGAFFFVLVNAGLIEFVYQVAKAVVLSWMPVMPIRPAAVAFKAEVEDIEAVLAENPLPLLMLNVTLRNYLFYGTPHAAKFPAPPPNYAQPLEWLTNFNERFIIAHEYGHTLHDALDLVHPSNPEIGEELTADLIAFRIIVESGQTLDRMPPDFSTWGAYFTLAALNVVRQGLDLARHGEIREDLGFAGHPPFALRHRTLQQYHLRTVGEQQGALSIRTASTPARTLELLWKHLLEQGVAQHWAGLTLHRIWDGT